MKKSIAWILTVIMMLALLTGCGSKSAKSDTEYVKKNGKLIVGITDYEPMDYKDENGEWTGFDAEFARMFAKELGVDCEFFVIADWGQKFFELDSKNIDAIWNGMTITDERMENMFFAKPYIANQQIVVVPAASGIETIDDIVGKKIGLQKGSSSLDALMASPVYEQVKDDVTEYPDNVAAYMDLQAGRIDVFVVDSVVGRYILSQNQE